MEIEDQGLEGSGPAAGRSPLFYQSMRGPSPKRWSPQWTALLSQRKKQRKKSPVQAHRAFGIQPRDQNLMVAPRVM
jgi:hypothetical protein